MIFHRIQGPYPHLDIIQTWYEQAFPPAERRQFDALRQLLSCPDMHFCALETNHQQLVGFIIYWHWPDAVFVEHLAIDPNERGKQFGQRTLSQLLALDSPCFLLEVEPPIDDLSHRRIQFYERQGFLLNPFPYAQPPYLRDGQPVPMHLMSKPLITSQTAFVRYRQLISERVYERFYDKISS